MKSLSLALGFVALFATQGASASLLVGSFNPLVSVQAQGGPGGAGTELILKIGSGNGDDTAIDPASFTFAPASPVANAGEIHQYRYDWVAPAGTVLPATSGTVFWTGSLQEFFDRTIGDNNLALRINGFDLTFSGFGTENGNGIVFSGTDLSPLGGFPGGFWQEANVVGLTTSEISIVPLPGVIWLLGSGLLCLAPWVRRRVV